MRIAIAGCGMAGMAAAIHLKRQGIKFDIYDADAYAGDFPARASIMLPVYTRPVWHLPKFIEDRFGIKFRPYVPIKKIYFHSRGAKALAQGKLGHVYIRGRADGSIDFQLLQQFTGKVFWNRSVKPEELLDYDWVIDARGVSPIDAPGSQSYLFKGGLIRGKFEPGVNRIWHHSLATPGGYGYLTPITEKIASLTVVVPKGRIDDERDFFEVFWSVLSRDLGYEPDLLRREQLERRLAQGPTHVHRKIIPVGNSLGSTTPFLGMDPLQAFSSSYYAVRQIAGHPGYYGAVRNLGGHMRRMHTIQAGMGRWSDGAHDLLVRLMSVGATPFFNSRLNLLSVTSRLLKPWV